MNVCKYDEVVLRCLAKEIENARLENGVIKMTDSINGVNWVEWTVPADKLLVNCIYYILEKFEQHSSICYLIVSNTGELFCVSANLIEDFVTRHKVLNARISNGKVHLFVIKRHTSPLMHH